MAPKKETLYAGKKLVATYLSPVTAQALQATANKRGLSRSRFVQLLIEHVVNFREINSEELSLSHYPKTEKKTRAYTTHLTEGEGMRLEAEAKRHGMKPSPFINMILRGVLTSSISLSDVEHDEIRKIRSELAKVGTNLNQAVKLLRANPYGKNHITADLLKDVQKNIEVERTILGELLAKNMKTWANYGK